MRDEYAASGSQRILSRLRSMYNYQKYGVQSPRIGKLKKIDRHAESGTELHGLILPMFTRKSLRTTRFPPYTLKSNLRIHHLNIGPRRVYDHDSVSIVTTAVNHVDRGVGYKQGEESRSGRIDTSNETTTLEPSGNFSDINNSIRVSGSGNHSNSTEFEVLRRFARSLDEFEGKFYNATFAKLVQISPKDRRENGVSFVHSALFVNLALLTLSAEVDKDTKAEIDQCLDINATEAERATFIREVVSSLPSSSEMLTYRRSSRLVLGMGQELHNPPTVDVKLNRLNATLAADKLIHEFNTMIEEDSGGAMHNTFEEDELSDGFQAALLSVVYFRARWRAAPTLLNGSRPFYDGDAPPRTTRMMKINDIMRYADIAEWDAQALEISYASPGLTLVLIVPRGRSIRSLAERVASVPISQITARMEQQRVAATLPLYTLRMTLLLPSKLQAMGIKRLVDTNSTASSSDLRLSHAVQRLMFWAEAGRNAFKDDGIEWDEAPKSQMVVDRPYVFFVRWRNLTLMSGNFVL